MVFRMSTLQNQIVQPSQTIKFPPTNVEEIRSLRVSCKFVICVCVHPEFISLQTACFRRFLKQPFEMCIVDDSRTEELSEQIKAVALAEGHEYLRSPPHEPHRADSSTRHADTLMFGWKNMHRLDVNGQKFKYIGTFDSDLFPVTPIDLDSVLETNDMMCVKKQREHAYYFWPGCCLWRTDVHNLEDFHWDICLDEGGIRLDTGGTTYHYWKEKTMNPLLLNEYLFLHIEREKYIPLLSQLPQALYEFCIWDILIANSCEIAWASDIFSDPHGRFVFFHLRDVSNWGDINKDYHNVKCQNFVEACKTLL
jgi:hypothetical protein